MDYESCSLKFRIENVRGSVYRFSTTRDSVAYTGIHAFSGMSGSLEDMKNFLDENTMHTVATCERIAIRIDNNYFLLYWLPSECKRGDERFFVAYDGEKFSSDFADFDGILGRELAGLIHVAEIDNWVDALNSENMKESDILCHGPSVFCESGPPMFIIRFLARNGFIFDVDSCEFSIKKSGLFIKKYKHKFFITFSWHGKYGLLVQKIQETSLANKVIAFYHNAHNDEILRVMY